MVPRESRERLAVRDPRGCLVGMEWMEQEDQRVTMAPLANQEEMEGLEKLD